MTRQKKRVVVLATSWMGEKAKDLVAPDLEVKLIGDQRPEALAEELPTADALITGLMPITREMMERAPRLVILSAIGVGYNHIDIPAATDLGIVVTHNPGTNSDAVAEFTFGLILALQRRIPHSWGEVKRGGWREPGFWGSELRGKTLGIIGLGRIGSRVSRIGRAFGLHVLAFDPYITAQAFDDAFAREAPRDTVISQSDILTVHVPLTAETKKMIGAPEFSIMKKGAVFINTARGEIIKDEALLEALDQGPIAGAAVDVFQEEPPRDLRIIGHPKIIATAHIAGLTDEARLRMTQGSAEQVIQALKGKKPTRALNEPNHPRYLRTNF